MAWTQRGRLKGLATSVYRVAPDLNPRIDRFLPNPELPTEAVVVDVYEGVADLIPGMRLVCWKSGAEWRAKNVVFDPSTLDVLSINNFTDRAPSDDYAPRWLIGAVWASLAAKVAPGILTGFDADDVEGLPPEVRGHYGAIWLKSERMRLIFES